MDMSALLELPSPLDGLADRGDDLAGVIEKVREYAPTVAEIMEMLASVSDQVTDERMDEFADQSLDLRRTNMAILVALLHDAVIGLGAVLFSIDVLEWLGYEDDAVPSAQGAVYGLAESLAIIAAGIRPASRE